MLDLARVLGGPDLEKVGWVRDLLHLVSRWPTQRERIRAAWPREVQLFEDFEACTEPPTIAEMESLLADFDANHLQPLTADETVDPDQRLSVPVPPSWYIAQHSAATQLLSDIGTELAVWATQTTAAPTTTETTTGRQAAAGLADLIDGLRLILLKLLQDTSPAR